MKSEIEKKFDEVGNRYFDMFGKRYPLIITSQKTISEHIKIMEECIRTGKPEKVGEMRETV